MSKIVIYGGQGYIGRSLMRLLQDDYEIYNISRLRYKKNKYLKYINISGRLWHKIQEVCYIRPEYFIINFFGNPKNNSKDLYEKIITSILKIDNTLMTPVTFIFLSSQLVYGGLGSAIKSEDDLLSPMTMYARMCEKMERTLTKKIKNQYIIFRVPILYGNSNEADGYQNIVNKFISIAKKKQNITIYGSGEHSRTFLHVNDLAQLVKSSIDLKIKGEIINASAGDFLTIIDVANLIAKHYNVGADRGLKWPSGYCECEATDINLDYKKAANLFKEKNTFKKYIIDLL